MTTSLTLRHAWKLWHVALSALERAEGPDQSTRQMANLPQVYIVPLLKTLRRPTDIPRIFNLAAVLVMGAQNHTKFAWRKRDEGDKPNVLILPIVEGAKFLSEFSAGMVVASEIL